MFVCRTAPIVHRKDKRVLQAANHIIEVHRKKHTGSKPYILATKLKPPVKFFIDDFHYHLNNKSLNDKVERYRLIPCVFELLKFTDKLPQEKGSGKDNYVFRGQTPGGDCFTVVVRQETGGNYTLQSIHPKR
jgi:hypothetical protein